MSRARATIQPGKLWSLLEIMLKKAGLEFGQAFSNIGMVLAMAEMSANKGLDGSGHLASAARDTLSNLKRVCILTDMEDVFPEIDRFGAAIEVPTDVKDMASRMRHLRDRLFDDLASEYFVQLRKEHVEFYEQPALFGETVNAKFKVAKDDIRNAGTCLALEQPMATIFHLMRVLEIAINSLARRLKVNVSPKDTWGMILNNMTNAIGKMPEKTPAQKAKKERWSELRTMLFHVKEAWRDNSLHARRKSATLSESREIFDAVRAFMKHLAAL